MLVLPLMIPGLTVVFIFTFVLQWGNLESRFKRAYTTLRIPESVALRVHRRLRIARQ